MPEQPKYINGVADGYSGPRCQYAYGQLPHQGKRCGLAAWPDASEDEPRCAFHSEGTPVDLTQALDDAIKVKADLCEVDLSGANLIRANLRGAGLRHANLSRADLRAADLSGADLSHTNLSGAVLSYAKLAHADLSSADLSGGHLEGADLSGATLLVTDLSGVMARDASFRAAHLACARLRLLWCFADTSSEGGQLTGCASAPDLGNADFRGARLRDITMDRETNLGEARFGPADGATSEDRIADEAEALPDYGACAQVYRQLKVAFRDSGDHGRAGNFYVGEMRCMRKASARDLWPNLTPRLKREADEAAWAYRLRELTRSVRLLRAATGRALGGLPRSRLRARDPWKAVSSHLRLLWLCIFERAAGYGERPSWVLGWALLVVVICAFVHGACGIGATDAHHLVPKIGPGLEWPSPDGFGRFLTALHFSFCTFTTLGCGGLQPSTAWGRLFSGLEGALGLALMALFLFCIARRVGR